MESAAALSPPLAASLMLTPSSPLPTQPPPRRNTASPPVRARSPPPPPSPCKNSPFRQPSPASTPAPCWTAATPPTVPCSSRVGFVAQDDVIHPQLIVSSSARRGALQRPPGLTTGGPPGRGKVVVARCSHRAWHRSCGCPGRRRTSRLLYIAPGQGRRGGAHGIRQAWCRSWGWPARRVTGGDDDDDQVLSQREWLHGQGEWIPFLNGASVR